MSILWTGTRVGKDPWSTVDPAARAANGSEGAALEVGTILGTPLVELAPPAELSAFGGGVGGGLGIPGTDLAFFAGFSTCLGLIQSRRAERRR